MEYRTVMGIDGTWSGLITYVKGAPGLPPMQKPRCFYCKAEKSSLRKCTRCGAKYCDVTCQRKDWTTRNHKEVCWRDDVYGLMKPLKIFMDASKGLPPHDSTPQPGLKFAVKIQADDQLRVSFSPTCPMQLYDRSRAVYGHVKPGDPHYLDLQFYIQLKGYNRYTGQYGRAQGIKWYFWAEMTEEGMVKYYPNRPLKQLPSW